MIRYNDVELKAAANKAGLELRIDGQRINHLISVDICAGHDRVTSVTLSFYADVDVESYGKTVVRDGDADG